MKKTRKVITSAMALALCMTVGFSAAACGGSTDEKTINIWAYCDGDEEKVNYELISEFNRIYADKGIRAKFTPYSASSWEEKMKATLSSSTGPDVFLCNDQYYKQWATLGFLENLDPYIQSNDPEYNMEASIADMYSGGVGRYLYDVNTTTDDGPDAHYYGLPKGTGATAIYYNKTYMKNANIQEISVYEDDIDDYNAMNGTAYPKKAYFVIDGQYYFNNKIAMSWQECADLATKLQSNSKNKQAGCKEGFLTSWWFNYGFSVGASCLGHIDTTDEAYNGGYYTFTLADSTVNYKTKTSLTVNGTTYEAGEIVEYQDKFYLTDESAAQCDVLPSQRQAFSEYMSLAGSTTDDKYYPGEVGVTDIFWELVPYKLASTPEECIQRNDQIMKNDANGYVPSAAEQYGTEQVVVYNKGISPNPNLFKTDGRISYFYQGKVAMCVELRSSVQDCRQAMTDDWDVAPMLVYKEFDENEQVTISGIEGAHSGSTAWCVWSKSKNKDLAYLFVKFATSEEGQRLLCGAGTIIANQQSIADEMVQKDIDAGLKPYNLEIFNRGAEYQTPGDWWFLKDGDWIDAEGCWANYLNQTVRNYKASIPDFYLTNDYKGTFDKLLEYTKK